MKSHRAGYQGKRGTKCGGKKRSNKSSGTGYRNALMCGHFYTLGLINHIVVVRRYGPGAKTEKTKDAEEGISPREWDLAVRLLVKGRSKVVIRAPMSQRHPELALTWARESRWWAGTLYIVWKKTKTPDTGIVPDFLKKKSLLSRLKKAGRSST